MSYVGGPGLRALRADRSMRARSTTRCATPGARSRPARRRLLRDRRAAHRSRPARLGRRARRPTKRRRSRPRATRSRSTSRSISSAATRCCGSASAASRKRLVQFTLDDPAAFPWGGEPILMDGRSVGELTSAGYSRKLGRAVAFGYAKSPARRYAADRRDDRNGALRDRHRGRRFAASVHVHATGWR